MVCAIVLLFYCCFAAVGLHGDPHGDRVPVVSGDGDCFPPPRLAGLAGTGISGDRGGDGGVPPGDPRPRCHLDSSTSGTRTATCWITAICIY